MALEDWYFRISVLIFLCISKKIWQILYTFWIGPAMNNIDIKSFGKWALITGATDGIGKEYARQLAARGCDIILVSRSLDKLEKVASEISKEFKVETKIIQIDFTGDLSIYDKLAKEIEGFEIGTLVNNVGYASPHYEYFLDQPDRNNTISTLMNVNMVSMVRVTSVVMPGMLKRGKGIVINLGSLSANIPFPFQMVYAATKAFVEKFSEGLRYEYGSKNIIIQHLSPGTVATNMVDLDTNLFVPNAETYVKSALGMVGCVTSSHGYLPHAIGRDNGLRRLALSFNEISRKILLIIAINHNCGEMLKEDIDHLILFINNLVDQCLLLEERSRNLLPYLIHLFSK